MSNLDYDNIGRIAVAFLVLAVAAFLMWLLIKVLILVWEAARNVIALNKVKELERENKALREFLRISNQYNVRLLEENNELKRNNKVSAFRD